MIVNFAYCSYNILVEYSNGMEKKKLFHKNENTDVVKASSKLFNVGVGLSHTVNIGNFENVKFSLQLNSPTDNIDETFEKSVEWLGTKLEELKAAYLEE